MTPDQISKLPPELQPAAELCEREDIRIDTLALAVLKVFPVALTYCLQMQEDKEDVYADYHDAVKRLNAMQEERDEAARQSGSWEQVALGRISDLQTAEATIATLTRERNEYRDASYLRVQCLAKLETAEAEVTRLRGELEKLSGIMPHQHCHTCNQFAEGIKSALSVALIHDDGTNMCGGALAIQETQTHQMKPVASTGDTPQPQEPIEIQNLRQWVKDAETREKLMYEHLADDLRKGMSKLKVVLDDDDGEGNFETKTLDFDQVWHLGYRRGMTTAARYKQQLEPTAATGKTPDALPDINKFWHIWRADKQGNLRYFDPEAGWGAYAIVQFAQDWQNQLLAPRSESTDK